MVAAYRIAVQGWTPGQAYAEMQKFGCTEGFEEDKLTFINDFANYWSQVPPPEKTAILHRSFSTEA